MPRFAIKAEADKSDDSVGVITLFYEIDHSGWWGVSAASFHRALRSLGKRQKIRVLINSYGGDVFDGIAMRSHLERYAEEHGATIEVEVEGIAASAASIVMTAATPGHRLMRTGSFVMIHNPWTLVIGDYHELRAAADVLESIAEEMVGIYMLATDQDEETIREWCKKEKWMGSKEAIKLGFADEVLSTAANIPDEDDSDKRQARAAKALACRLGIDVEDDDARPAVAALTSCRPPRSAKASASPSAVVDLTASDTAAETDGGESAASPPSPSENSPAATQAAADRTRVPRDTTRNASGLDTMEEKIAELLARIKQSQANIEDTFAETGGNDLTSEQTKTIAAHQADIDDAKNQVKVLQSAVQNKADLEEPQGRRSTPADSTVRPTQNSPVPATPRTETAQERFLNQGTCDFSSLGEFMVAVRSAGAGGDEDRRLGRIMNASEQTGAVNDDGGYLLPGDFRTEFYDMTIAQEPIVSRCLMVPTSQRSVFLPKRNRQPFREADGFEAYYTGEAAERKKSQTGMEMQECRVKKLTVDVDVSEELYEDAPAMDAFIRLEAFDTMQFAVSNAIVRGAGGPLLPTGFMKSNALITVAPKTPGTAGSFEFDDAANMYARIPPRDRKDAFWLVSPGLLSKLIAMKTPDGDHLLTYAPGTVDQAPKMMILGHEVVIHEVCNAAGSLGDIFFVSLKRTYAITERSKLNVKDTIYAEWKRDLQSFKFTWRHGGDPLYDAAVKSRDGDFTLSPYVTLGARAG